MPFFIITASTLVACFVSFILVLRTIKFYKRDMYEKFIVEPEALETEMGATINSNVPIEREPLSSFGNTKATIS